MRSFMLLFFSLFFINTSCSSHILSKKPPLWAKQIDKKIKLLEQKFGGEFGVYIKDLENQDEYSHRASQFWYLSSTTKIPVAIAVLKLVDQNKLELAEKVVIKKSDYRDGAGAVNWIKEGRKVSYRYLLDQMLIYSDNAATDLLIKKVGLDNINNYASKYSGGNGFGPITTLLDVRKKAYSEFHPKAKSLSNLAFFAVKKQKNPTKKLNELAKQLKVKPKDLKTKNLSQGFDQYYAQHWNSAPLTSYAQILERLVKGEVLSDRSTYELMKILSKIHTGKKRIRSGLSKNTFFAHKTGTQHRQACDLGVAGSKKVKKAKVLILVCVKNWKKLSEAEKLMAKVGKMVSKTDLL